MSTGAHTRRRRAIAIAIVSALLALSTPPKAAAQYKIVGWNNLGMHCMDDDYSVFSILPPYNTIDAHLIDPSGNLILTPGNITLTYQAVADPDGSINTTSAGKTNFWVHLPALLGASLPVDAGLAGKGMPGTSNTPQPMTFDPSMHWFEAVGIPITPIDDQRRYNPYPMMRIIARAGNGTLLAQTDIVLPVSTEMDCRACHSSTSNNTAAQPAAGWVNDPNPSRDYRLNILRLHDDRQAGNATYIAALANLTYSPLGLYATATGGTSIMCAQCHPSEALPGLGQPGVAPLTQSMHAYHAHVINPQNGLTMDDITSRTSCYQCHPGSTTKCLRGAMGAAVSPADGTLSMQCQSCHGSMSEVGASTRTGWLDEPNCQNCHTGTATSNNGQIRYLTAFDSPGHLRVAANATFATNPNTPPPGKSLFRFSRGHANLTCSACHGSTHAEFPSSHRNDNIANFVKQGHVGVLSECTACHSVMPNTITGGPHGMHPTGANWIDAHKDAANDGRYVSCRACHGTDDRGTVLSRAFSDRTFALPNNTTVTFFKGAVVGCYACHSGPTDTDIASNRRLGAAISNRTLATAVSTPANLTLNGSVSNTFRIVQQPMHGTVSIIGRNATYHPDPGYAGPDWFSFASWNGSIDSNFGIVSTTVGGPSSLTADGDLDGLTSLVEYVLGLDPAFPSGTATPTVAIEKTSGTRYLTLAANTMMRPPDATLAAEVSGDLERWYSGPGNTTVLANTPYQFKVRDNTPADSLFRRFMRFRAGRQ